MSDHKTLTRKQRDVLAALVKSKTVIEAAKIAGVSKDTVYRYMKLPEFQAELTKVQDELVEQATRILVQGQLISLTTLADLIQNAKKDSDRRRAAVSWMELTERWVELQNLERRIRKLEEAQDAHP